MVSETCDEKPWVGNCLAIIELETNFQLHLEILSRCNISFQRPALKTKSGCALRADRLIKSD